MTIRELLKLGEKELAISNIDNPAGEALILLAYALGKKKEWLLAHPESVVPYEKGELFFSFVRRRSQGEPVAYITGKKGFFNIELVVTPEVLIPRPETEALVEEALKLINIHNIRFFVDIGTGSGNISLAILNNHAHVKAIATDISYPALLVAKRNSRQLKLEGRVQFIQGNLLEPFKTASIPLIVSNPPYVGRKEISKLQREIHFEPREALVGGEEGHELSIQLLSQAYHTLQKGGWVLIETSPQLAPLLLEYCRSLYKMAYSVKDLSGYERVIVAHKN